MRTIGFRTSNQARMRSAISPELIRDSTDRQIVTAANNHIRDAVSALREARRDDSKEGHGRTRDLLLIESVIEPETGGRTKAKHSLEKAAYQFFVLRKANPPESSIATQAYKAEIRVERWINRLSNGSSEVDLTTSHIESGELFREL